MNLLAAFFGITIGGFLLFMYFMNIVSKLGGLMQNLDQIGNQILHSYKFSHGFEDINFRNYVDKRYRRFVYWTEEGVTGLTELSEKLTYQDEEQSISLGLSVKPSLSRKLVRFAKSCGYEYEPTTSTLSLDKKVIRLGDVEEHYTLVTQLTLTLDSKISVRYALSKIEPK